MAHETTTRPDELAAIGRAEELHLASLRDDGMLRPYVRFWVVRAGDHIYVRAAHGPANGGYLRPCAAARAASAPAAWNPT